jgi:hypothetical protein
LVTATIIPITTNTTIAACSQIQVGDIDRGAYRRYRVGMQHGRLRLATLLLVPVIVAAALAAATLASAQPLAASAKLGGAPLGGVNVVGLTFASRPVEADQAIAYARQLHAKVVRTEVSWAVLEPRAKSQLDAQALAFLDRLLGDAAAAGIKVIATLRGTPCWDSSAPASLLSKCEPASPSGATAWPPRNPADYAAVAAYLARRYGTQLAAIEVWNEPDQGNELYFAGPSKPQRYAALLRAAYPAIKQANPNVLVLAGSLVGSNGAFLRALYAAGIKGFYDGLAIHYYNLTLGSVRAIRQVQVASGDEKPLWLDEFGWTSCWPGERVQQEQACVTPRVQALNIANIFRSLARTSYVAADVIFQLHDQVKEDFGLVTATGAHKPAFSSLASVIASPFGHVSPVTVGLHRHRGRIVAAGSGPVGDFMQLEVFKGKVLRYHALFTLDRFNRYAITLPRVLGTHGMRVRVFQYWMGSASAAQKSI